MLLLASASPRRLDLLRQIGLEPTVLAVAVDESVRSAESPAHYVARLAEDKARASAAVCRRDGPVWILAADTTVVAGGQILGKPASFEDACRIWDLLPSPDHRVLTAVALWHDGVVTGRVVTTEVRFAAIPPEARLAYWRTGEPADKAGGYAIQGRAAIHVEGLVGSYSNVVGLPLAETAALLRAAGFPFED